MEYGNTIYQNNLNCVSYYFQMAENANEPKKRGRKSKKAEPTSVPNEEMDSKTETQTESKTESETKSSPKSVDENQKAVKLFKSFLRNKVLRFQHQI